jgi:uncharacterized protein (TIGR02147 family)
VPDIFDYTDYRKYLADLYAFRKQANRGFSYRAIAQKAGIASPSFIGKILAGESNISHQTLMRLIDVFQIAGPEAEYFELMDKNHYFQRMRAQRRRYGKPQDEDPHGLFAVWYVQPILTLVELGLFHGDYAALGRMLTPPVSAQEARLALESLMLHGLVHKDRGGRHVRSEAPDNAPASAPPPTAEPPESPSREIARLLETLPEALPHDLQMRIDSLRHELLRLLRQAHGLPRRPG